MSREEFSFKVGDVTICFVKMYSDCWICSLPEMMAKKLKMEMSPHRFISVKDLGLTTRATNALIADGITNVAGILEEWHRLLWLPNIGPKTKKDIIEKLKEYAISVDDL